MQILQNKCLSSICGGNLCYCIDEYGIRNDGDSSSLNRCVNNCCNEKDASSWDYEDSEQERNGYCNKKIKNKAFGPENYDAEFISFLFKKQQ